MRRSRGVLFGVGAATVLLGAGLLLLAGCPGGSLDNLAPKKTLTPYGEFTLRTIYNGGSGAKDFKQPAFIRFGPDGRLYATTYTGSLYAFTLDQQHDVTSVQVYQPCGNRLLTGMAFDPDSTPAAPVLYLANNDTPIYGAPDYSGRVTRFEIATGKVEDVIAGLPRSAENHMTFDLEFGLDGRLYISQGGNTNNGAPFPGLFDNRPESRLSAAVLAADVKHASFSGLADVEVFAPGLRNTYAICLHTNGHFYGVDQGANKGLGGAPTPAGGTVEVPNNLPDEINVLLPGRYFGHPNPARGQYAWQADLLDGTPHQDALKTFAPGTIVTGITEYPAAAGNGKLQGKLLMTAFIGGHIWAASLSPDGLGVTALEVLADGFSNPLDLAVGPGGTIYVLEAGDTLAFGGAGVAKISVLEPAIPDPAPGKAPTMFTRSTSCTDCHTELVDSAGHNVSIPGNWRPTMMANAARDPYFRAKVSSEVARTPAAAEAIEAKCAKCHTPMATTQALADGDPVALLGQGFNNPQHPAHMMAIDGVSCTVCHQIRDVGLGQPASFSGNYHIDTVTDLPHRAIFGPFPEPSAALMQAASQYVPAYGAHLSTSALCGACHTLYTDTLDPAGNVIGSFPEQTTYLEWEHSSFAANGPQGRTCQACHMPAAEGAVVISSLPGNTPARSPFRQHHFVGANSFMLGILKAERQALGVEATEAELDAAIGRTLDQLTQRTATLALAGWSAQPGTLQVDVTVTNLAGHKLPSGYPSRRAWIRLEVADGSGAVVFASGTPQADGRLAGDDSETDATTFEPHYDLISEPDQVQIYQSVMIDATGAVTQTLLRAAGYAKDNRLLPAGFDKLTAPADLAPYGEALGDDDFVGGSDVVRYEVRTTGRTGPFSVRAELLYQSVPPGWARDLQSHTTPEIDAFTAMYAAADPSPVLVAARQTTIIP